MKEWFKNLRYKIAYAIAPDWIDDLEHRLSVFLSNQTGGVLSKCYYSVDTMVRLADDYRERLCEYCPYYKHCLEESDHAEN